MLERIKGKFYVSCDTCGETLEDGYTTVDEALAALRENDFSTMLYETDDEATWQNFCPDCQN